MASLGMDGIVRVRVTSISGLWRGILTVKEAFAKSIRYHVGSGEKIFFWLDTWTGDRPLVE